MDELNVTRESRVIEEMPKVELHIHLEGSVRKETAKELANYYGMSGVNPDIISSITKYEGLTHFVSTIKSVMDSCLKCSEDYERIACELFQDLENKNIIYAEVSFDPTRGFRLGIPVEKIFEAVINAKNKIEAYGKIKIGLIIGVGREYGLQVVKDFAKMAAAASSLGIVGFDLHGNEASEPPGTFKEAFDIARNAGLGLRAHAGEGTGTENIWEAINILGVSRIAHGIDAVQDEKLMKFIKERNITLDVCPTSNYMLGVAKSFEQHPIRKLYDYGIRTTVSTDDPLFFNTDMVKEFEILSKYMGFTLEDLYKINLYSVEGAFLPTEEKEKLKEKIVKSKNVY